MLFKARSQGGSHALGVRRRPKAVCGGPASTTHHAFASCCHWANVPFHHLHPPSLQTLVPLRFTKGSMDTPNKGPALPAVEPLSDLGDPCLWTSCGLNPWNRQTSSEVTSQQSAPSPKPPRLWYCHLHFPEKQKLPLQTVLMGFHRGCLLTTKSSATMWSLKKKKASHPRDCLDYNMGCRPAKLLQGTTENLVCSRSWWGWAAHGPGHRSRLCARGVHYLPNAASCVDH